MGISYTEAMTPAQILKSQDFTEVAEVRPDDKKRILLRKVKKAGKMYRIFENPLDRGPHAR